MVTASDLDNPGSALTAVCDFLGLDPSGARLLRFTNNAVFRLAACPLVVRILGARSLRHRVRKVVDVARWLERHELPAIRLWHGARQPVEVGGHLATVWWAVADTGREPTPEDLGVLLRRLHELPVPGFAVPRWEPLGDVRRRLGDTDLLSETDRSFLLERCDAVERGIAELHFPHRNRLLHGDAHLGNLIGSPSGPVLCDFDSASVGPPEADMVTFPVGARRFGDEPGTYVRFRDAYGYDVTAWEGYGLLAEARELKLVTSALPRARGEAGLRAEVFRRLDDFRRGDHSRAWTRYG